MKIKLLCQTRNWLGISILCSLLLLSGCATTKPQPTGGGPLGEIQSLNSKSAAGSGSGKVNEIRYQALKETALSLGAQTGLAYRAKQIDAMLKQNKDSLDHVYNFNLLLLDHNVLPPVLVKGDHTLNLANPHTIRLADTTYKIVSQARFVTTPPTWRSYLWLDFPNPQTPDPTLLPQNQYEQAIWSQYTAQGFQAGVTQANNIYATNLAKLTRDYRGMILYRKLLTEGMVSRPYVAKSDLGITGGGNKLTINDRILRITALPKLQRNTKHWHPIIADQNS